TCMINNAPRVLAFAAFTIATVSLLFSGAIYLAVTTLAGGIAFYYFLVQRQDLSKKLSRGTRSGRFFLPRQGVTSFEHFRDWPPVAKSLLVASLVLYVILMVFLCFAPASTGGLFGSAAMAFVGFGTLVPIGSILVFLSHRGGAAARRVS